MIQYHTPYMIIGCVVPTCSHSPSFPFLRYEGVKDNTDFLLTYSIVLLFAGSSLPAAGESSSASEKSKLIPALPFGSIIAGFSCLCTKL